MTSPATPGEAFAALVTHWPGSSPAWNAAFIAANRGRLSRLPHDQKRAVWSAIKAKGGV